MFIKLCNTILVKIPQKTDEFSELFELLELLDAPSSDINKNFNDDNESQNEEEQKETQQLSVGPSQVVECLQNVKGQRCNFCLLCCYRFLLKYNLCCSAYSTLSAAYEYLLTLSCTQVSCERAFRKLKIIKTRLRSSMQLDFLETCMLMSVERNLLEQIQFEKILTIIQKNSDLMDKLLTV